MVAIDGATSDIIYTEVCGCAIRYVADTFYAVQYFKQGDHCLRHSLHSNMEELDKLLRVSRIYVVPVLRKLQELKHD